MAHIKLNNEMLPGIVGLLDYRRETAKPLCELAEVLLRGESGLSSGEREVIASYVSYKNDCHFCHTSHGAAAAAHLGKGSDFIDDIKSGVIQNPISDKMRALLVIAEKVQKGGKNVLREDVEHAKQLGATDRDIHDTVLIAAAFCMFNRYVDGLGTWSLPDNESFMPMGANMAHHGYVRNELENK